jgi:hypothetical protein
VERATGIEPAFSAWEADVLPLNYARGRPPHYRLARHGSSDRARGGPTQKSPAKKERKGPAHTAPTRRALTRRALTRRAAAVGLP